MFFSQQSAKRERWQNMNPARWQTSGLAGWIINLFRGVKSIFDIYHESHLNRPEAMMGIAFMITNGNPAHMKFCCCCCFFSSSPLSPLLPLIHPPSPQRPSGRLCRDKQFIIFPLTLPSLMRAVYTATTMPQSECAASLCENGENPRVQATGNVFENEKKILA